MPGTTASYCSAPGTAGSRGGELHPASTSAAVAASKHGGRRRVVNKRCMANLPVDAGRAARIIRQSAAAKTLRPLQQRR